MEDGFQEKKRSNINTFDNKLSLAVHKPPNAHMELEKSKEKVGKYNYPLK